MLQCSKIIEKRLHNESKCPKEFNYECFDVKNIILSFCCRVDVKLYRHTKQYRVCYLRFLEQGLQRREPKNMSSSILLSSRSDGASSVRGLLLTSGRQRPKMPGSIAQHRGQVLESKNYPDPNTSRDKETLV